MRLSVASCRFWPAVGCGAHQLFDSIDLLIDVLRGYQVRFEIRFIADQQVAALPRLGISEGRDDSLEFEKQRATLDAPRYWC